LRRSTVLASAGTSSPLVLAVVVAGAVLPAVPFSQLIRRIPNSAGRPYARGDRSRSADGEATTSQRADHYLGFTGLHDDRLYGRIGTPRGPVDDDIAQPAGATAIRILHPG
jgi:hypothetical protein